MTKACLKMSGTSTTNGASVLFFGFHWSFAILAPSGKGWPLPGMPDLKALIMIGLATITLSTSSVRAEETTDQSSYPLKSEKAIPSGDFSEYFSCASTAMAPRMASAGMAIAIVSLLLRVMAEPFLTGNGTAYHTQLVPRSHPSARCEGCDRAPGGGLSQV